MHRIDDQLLDTSFLNRRLIMESNDGKAWILKQDREGAVHVRDNGLTVHVTQQAFAHRLIRILNKEVWLDGAWVVGWTHGGNRLMIIYIDADGDPQFTIENDEPVSVIMSVEPLKYAEDAWDAYHLWKENRKALDLRPDETFKRAQGEKPKSGLLPVGE